MGKYIYGSGFYEAISCQCALNRDTFRSRRTFPVMNGIHAQYKTKKQRESKRDH